MLFPPGVVGGEVSAREGTAVRSGGEDSRACWYGMDQLWLG